VNSLIYLAHLADAAVILVADIDRGGVFASIIGTLILLDDTERARVKGIIINVFNNFDHASYIGILL
jgi:adenosylcobyric acid synthase